MTIIHRLGGALAAVLLAAGTLAPAPVPAREAPLGDDARAIVERVEEWFNGFTTLKARFLQVGPDGSIAEGDAYLARPGKLRFDYDPPTPVFIVADGRSLIYRDEELDQTSYMPLGSTPAGLLVRRDVELDQNDDVQILNVHRGQGVVGVTLAQASDPGAGHITLLFDENPFALRQWRVRDAQGQITTVSLFEVEKNVRLSPELFRYSDPDRFYDQ